MKKYFIASVVAVMAFAFAAFAASLNVTAGNLQAGDTQPGALECADEAIAYVWGYNDHVTPTTVDNVGIALRNSDGTPHGCAGEWLSVNLLDEDGNIIYPGPGQIRVGKVAVAGEDQGRFTMPGADAAAKPKVEDIYGVRVGIEQGPSVGVWDDSPLNN
jgi:hypothetical protein